jgi:signal transduction histidine kinase
MTAAPPRQAISAPIAAQVVALLIAVVALSQVLILAIALLVPPPRPSIYRLTDIAAALGGQPVRPRDARPLERTVTAAAPLPAIGRPGPSAQDRAGLALILGVPESAVRFEETRHGPPLWDADVFAHRRRGFGPPRPPVGPNGEPGAGPGPIPGPGDPPMDGVGPGPDGRGWGAFGDAHRVVFDDFTAAVRQPSGAWAVVRPAREGFPNGWQVRVGLWFLACLAVLGPLGYVFARRLVAPIGAFASAADRLGRDPNAAPITLSGPAEIGVAARAFNTMQTRLQSYIADRTSMLAAISHDLRTPLARVRFKMEQAPEPLRASVAADLDEMAAMITAVLGFVRDASEVRERAGLDLMSVLECAVDDAVAAGGAADLISAEPVVVEADDLALKRLFANLIDNAIKYGERAEVRLSVQDGAAVVEIADRGPGLPSRELERVFEPFYRTEPSRSRETGGMGLGLAVARSIARAHGGDVTLKSAPSGLTAIVRLPLASRARRAGE